MRFNHEVYAFGFFDISHIILYKTSQTCRRFGGMAFRGLGLTGLDLSLHFEVGSIKFDENLKFNKLIIIDLSRIRHYLLMIGESYDVIRVYDRKYL
jgi:hypothetical protein